MSLSTVSGSSLLLSALTVSTCIKICSNGTLVETTEYMTVDNFGNNYIFSLHHFRGLENFTASYMNWSLFFPVVCLRHHHNDQSFQSFRALSSLCKVDIFHYMSCVGVEVNFVTRKGIHTSKVYHFTMQS